MSVKRWSPNNILNYSKHDIRTTAVSVADVIPAQIRNSVDTYEIVPHASNFYGDIAVKFPYTERQAKTGRWLDEYLQRIISRWLFWSININWLHRRKMKLISFFRQPLVFIRLCFHPLPPFNGDYTIRYGLTWAQFRRRSCVHATNTRAILRFTWCLESVVHARHSYIIRIKYASFSRAVYLPTSCKITTDQAPAGYTSLRDKHRSFFNRNVFRKVSRLILLKFWLKCGYKSPNINTVKYFLNANKILD